MLADSSGVPVVRVRRFTDLRPPTWRTRAIYSTTDNLFVVAGGVFLDDGSLVVSNAGMHELIRFSPGGESARWGRLGEGPGEYKVPMDVLQGLGNTLLVYDTDLYRLTRLNRDGSFVETLRVAPGELFVSLKLLAELESGAFLAIHREHSRFLDEGTLRDTVPLLRFRQDGGSMDTLGIWYGAETSFSKVPQGTLKVPVVFGRSLESAGHGGFVALGSTDSLDVTVYAPTAEVRLRILGPPNPTKVTPANIQAERERYRASSWMPDLAEQYASGPAHESFPAFRSLAVDDLGRVWIEVYPQGTRDRGTWMVFDLSGEPIARVDLPASAEILDIAGGRIALVTKDEYDTERLEVLQVR